MAKIKLSILNAIKKTKTEMQSSKYTVRIAMLARDLVYKRVKSGYGVTDDRKKLPQKKKLEPLSESYISFRQGKVAFYTSQYGHVYPVKSTKKKRLKKPVLGEKGSPRRSNLTFTGDMLESIEYTVSKNTITMRIPNSRRSDGKTNKEVAGYVREVRPFFALTDKENRLVLREYKRLVQQVLNKNI